VTLDPRGSTNRLPAPGAGFVWEALPVAGKEAFFLRVETDRCRAAYTTRQGGVSNGPVAKLNLSLLAEQQHGPSPAGPLRVFANRDLARRAIDGEREWITVKQVHGDRVVQARPRGPRLDADGIWTDLVDTTLGVVSADCVLVLALGRDKIGVAHAGWRGLAAGVVENIVRAVGADEVFAGPAIGPCCFEVGPEVIAAFPDAAPDPSHVDLWVAAEAAARRGGATTFHAARLCTSCHPDIFFSHRRDHGVTGRQGLIARIPA
jgi:YfiH family protein